MKLFATVSVVAAAVGAQGGAAPGQHARREAGPAGHRRIPTSYESAVMGRRILGLGKLATFSTVFPSSPAPSALRDSSRAQEDGVAGQPVGLVDYVADCEGEGNPTVLEIRIGTTFRNVRAGSNMTVSMRWTPPYPPARRIGVPPGGAAPPARAAASSWPWPVSSLASWLRPGGAGAGGDAADPGLPDTVPYSADNLPRFALFGYLEPVADADADADADATRAAALRDCYTAKHPDSRYWLPGNPIHASDWTRMVVTSVYWVGGFGDRAYIGWIPADEWRRVTEAEWRAIKLPGEAPGWSEWDAYDDQEL